MKEAFYYEQIGEKAVKCLLCPHLCRIKVGKEGICRVRYNNDGKLFTKNYGLSSYPFIDPIEKKPLYHYYPGSSILSLGTFGCNFQCSFCQNWQLAHGEPSLYRMSPESLVEMARNSKKEGSIGIAYTYSEPLVWYEFIKDTAEKAHQKGLKNILISNGFIEISPLKEILPFIDGFNIDIKGFTPDFYRKIIKGDFSSILKTAVEIRNWDKHLEITTLLIPGLNDEPKEIEELVRWIEKNLGKDIPIHFSRYSPNYQLDLPATGYKKLKEAWEIGKTYLDYVYIGNAPELDKSNTYCPVCNSLLIKRRGYGIDLINLSGKNCGHCGEQLNLIR